MSVEGPGRLGVRTDRFEETVALLRGPDGNVCELVAGGRQGA